MGNRDEVTGQEPGDSLRRDGGVSVLGEGGKRRGVKVSGGEKE